MASRSTALKSEGERRPAFAGASGSIVALELWPFGLADGEARDPVEAGVCILVGAATGEGEGRAEAGAFAGADAVRTARGSD